MTFIIVIFVKPSLKFDIVQVKLFQENSNFHLDVAKEVRLLKAPAPPTLLRRLWLVANVEPRLWIRAIVSRLILSLLMLVWSDAASAMNL